MSFCVVVTGASGFLGSYIGRLFAKEGWRVVGIDRSWRAELRELPVRGCSELHAVDVLDPAARLILRRVAPDVLVHAAGPASVTRSFQDPGMDFRDSVQATAALLESLRVEAPQCRFVYLSSAAVYGDQSEEPLNESSAPSPLSPYGYSKLLAEILCRQYFQMYGLPTIAVRIFSAYGQGLRRQVLWDLLQRHELAEGEVCVHGTGDERRDFIHALDVAKAIAIVAKYGESGGVYNVGSGRAVTIRDLVAMLREELGAAKLWRFVGGTTSGYPRVLEADTNRLSGLGFKPTFELRAGVKEYVAWARAEGKGRA
jgi:UDP-glucose 4-epimerase